MHAQGKGPPVPILRSRDPEGARGFDFLHMSARIPQGSFNILRHGPKVQIFPGALGGLYMAVAVHKPQGLSAG